MSHQLFRLQEKLSNTPHLMHLQSFETVLAYLTKRNAEDFKMDMSAPVSNREDNSRYSFNKDIGVAVLEIEGPLSYKPMTMMGFDCGGCSYQQLKEDFTYLADSGAKTIAFNISSGGGEAHQMLPTASYMRNLADEKGIKLLSYIDGLGASAAYGLACIADEIILAPSSEVGSIGVVVRLINDSKALEQEGYERTFIAAGASKTPYATDGSFRPDFLADIQSKVDTLYTEFTDFVAVQRNLSVEAVRGTEAKTFLPKQAIEIGLADAVMSLEEFYTYLADTAQRQEGSMLKTKLFNFNSKEETLEMTQLAELQEQLQAAQLSVSDVTSKFEAAALLLSEKETLLTQAQEQVAQLVAEKEGMKLTSRKTALAAVMSADKVEAVSASLSSLDDSAFETVLSGFAAQKQALEASEMFTEIGDQGTEAVVETTSKAKTSTEDLIKQKLGIK